jgi:hypothetical protein
MDVYELLNAAFQWASLRRPRADTGEGDHSEDDWVDGWIRQQQRVKQALAAAKAVPATTASAKKADEWVDGWIRQQQRLKEAFAMARQMHPPRGSADARDDWIDSWIRQQQRVRRTLAAAKPRTK